MSQLSVPRRRHHDRNTLNSLPRRLLGMVDLVFPPSCVQCRGLVEDNSRLRHVCSKCAGQIDHVSSPHCSTCGHPFYGIVEGERMCPHCEGLAPAFREGRTAVLMKGAGRALIHELKYHGGLHVLHDIEAIFRRAPHVLELTAQAILVPVPLHPRKLRERGYNQSELIAEHLALAVGGNAKVCGLLSRVIDTDSQTHHDRRDRHLNLKNAFALAKRAVLSAEQHYVLVDDVFTTGATLNSCAQTLRRAGILNLDVVTFGHG
jgi:ComF family protein